MKFPDDGKLKIQIVDIFVHMAAPVICNLR